MSGFHNQVIDVVIQGVSELWAQTSGYRSLSHKKRKIPGMY